MLAWCSRLELFCLAGRWRVPDWPSSLSFAQWPATSAPEPQGTTQLTALLEVHIGGRSAVPWECPGQNGFPQRQRTSCLPVTKPASAPRPFQHNHKQKCLQNYVCGSLNPLCFCRHCQHWTARLICAHLKASWDHQPLPVTPALESSVNEVPWNRAPTDFLALRHLLLENGLRKPATSEHSQPAGILLPN